MNEFQQEIYSESFEDELQKISGVKLNIEEAYDLAKETPGYKRSKLLSILAGAGVGTGVGAMIGGKGGAAGAAAVGALLGSILGKRQATRSALRKKGFAPSMFGYKEMSEDKKKMFMDN